MGIMTARENFLIKLPSLQSIKENLIVAGFFLGLLLPARFVFNEYLSHYWIGTFGVFSLVIFLIFYFSNRGKLGGIGLILVKKINQRAKGKLGKMFIINSIFVIYISGIIVLGSTYADPALSKVVTQTLHDQGVTDMKSMIAAPLPKPTPIQLLVSILVSITPNSISFAIFHSINDLSNGWLLSLSTIILVEEIEVLGIVSYLRYRFSKQ